MPKRPGKKASDNKPAKKKSVDKVSNLAKTRAHLHDRLQELTDAIHTDIDNLKGARGGDACDVAFNTTESELASLLAQHNATEVAHIKYALFQIDQGRYGICENCQSPITPGRLIALPYSVLCIDCQKLAEVGEINHDNWQRKWQRLTDARQPCTDDDDRPPDLSTLGP